MRRLNPYDQYEQREHPEWNLPPGVTPDDIDRLFGDQKPPEGSTCGTCRFAEPCAMLDGSDGLICLCDDRDLREIDEDAKACDGWEGII